MRNLSVTNFKRQFVTVIKLVKAGEEIIVTSVKQKQIVGIFKQLVIEKMPKRRICILICRVIKWTKILTEQQTKNFQIILIKITITPIYSTSVCIFT